jgi:hypothetical membrane protein
MPTRTARVSRLRIASSAARVACVECRFERAPVTGRTRRLMGGTFWIVGLAWFPAQVIAQAAWRTPYSLERNYISDLGAVSCRNSPSGYICSPLHAVMNGGFILLGVCTLLGAVLLWEQWPRGRLTGSGLVLITLSGAGKVLIGLAPEDQRLALHAVGSLGILFGNVACLLLGAALWRAFHWQSIVFVCIGAVGLVAFVLTLSPHFGIGPGAFERVADWPLPLWLGALGCLAVAGQRLAARSSDGPQSNQVAYE